MLFRSVFTALFAGRAKTGATSGGSIVVKLRTSLQPLSSALRYDFTLQKYSVLYAKPVRALLSVVVVSLTIVVANVLTVETSMR